MGRGETAGIVRAGAAVLAALCAWLTGMSAAWGETPAPSKGETPMAVSWWTGSVSLAVGRKDVPSLDAAHERQDLLGVRVTVGKNRWPAAVAFDLERSEGDTVGGEWVAIDELRLGARKAYGSGVLHPFWGAGLAAARLRFHTPSGTGRYGPDPGFWGEAGLNLDITRGSHIGISWVYTALDIGTPTGTVNGARGARVYWGRRW